jgi:hypothetical protein
VAAAGRGVRVLGQPPRGRGRELAQPARARGGGGHRGQLSTQRLQGHPLLLLLLLLLLPHQRHFSRQRLRAQLQAVVEQVALQGA